MTSVDDMIRVMPRPAVEIQFVYRDVDFNEVMQNYLDDYALSEITITSKDDETGYEESFVHLNFMIRLSLTTQPDKENPNEIIINMKLAQLTEVDYSLRKMSGILAKDHNYLTIPEYKKELIKESKEKLEEYLMTHPLISSCHGGKTAKYTATADKRNLWISNLMTYDVKVKAGIPAELMWNATGEPCEVWTLEEGVQFTVELEAYVHPLVTYQQELEVVINACETKQELDEIVIDYTNVYPEPNEE